MGQLVATEAVVAAVLEERTTGLWWHKKRRGTLLGMLGRVCRRQDALGGVAMIRGSGRTGMIGKGKAYEKISAEAKIA